MYVGTQIRTHPNSDHLKYYAFKSFNQKHNNRSFLYLFYIYNNILYLKNVIKSFIYKLLLKYIYI